MVRSFSTPPRGIWSARVASPSLFTAIFVTLLSIGSPDARAATTPEPDAAAAGKPTVEIKVDQAGYPLDGPHVALVSRTAGEPVNQVFSEVAGMAGATASAGGFELRRIGDNAVVFHGQLASSQADADTGDLVYAADFTAFHEPGSYYLYVPGVGRSWDFALRSGVYQRVYYLAMRGFYGQRCGTAVDLGAEFPGYSHPICHQQGEFHPSSGMSGPHNNLGGWHDAGDYGRYIVNASFASGTLLWTWELFGKKIENISLKIPESGNGVPDILNEVRWNLKWMLGMQDTDGGVWHKQSSEQFASFIAPEDDKQPSEVIGSGAAPYKTTCATADLAAVGAIAARVYKPYDAQFAAEVLESAERAWLWAEKNPNLHFTNPAGVNTGEYGDGNCQDERLWAAAELWRTTGDARYDSYFLANYAAFLASLDSPPAESWASLGAMGLWSYALSGRKGADTAAIAAIHERTVAAARAVVERTRASAYHVSLQTRDYVWGSNSIAAEYGCYLLIANLFHPDQSFVDAARDNLHYLLGRNTFSLSWVTQVGENPFQHPHHRPSGSGKQPGAPWPGLLSGGPNANRQDAVLARLPKNLPPAKVYADELPSYASNEICINWQASLVFLLAGEL